MVLVAVEFCEALGQPVQRPTDDGHVIVAFEVAHERGPGRHDFEVVTEVLVATAPSLVVLEFAEEVLGEVVGPGHHADTAAGAVGQLDGVPPEGVPVGDNVRQDDVDGLAGVLCRATGRPALPERVGPGVELLVYSTSSRALNQSF